MTTATDSTPTPVIMVSTSIRILITGWPADGHHDSFGHTDADETEGHDDGSGDHDG